MKVVSLEISENSRNLLKSDSIFNNHSDIDLYYFSIPTKLSISDQNHLIKQCFLFFQSQFAINIDNKISIGDKREIRINFKKSKDLSWEIFFRFNRWIRVCDGIFDEDLDWFISGFTGKIIDFYSDDETSVFLIAFSGKSIAKIPLDHLQKSINNISPFYTFLNPELIMPDTPPEDENIDEETRIGIMLKFINFQNYSDLLTIESFSEYLNYWEEQFRSNLV
ncbi:MAG: hypothetical protein IH585_18835, partial [Anaerolineaceae bacterium]|nr:hypothetical protein [Anaerolineaceae bacterium]